MNGFDEQVCALGAWALAVQAVHEVAARGRDERGALAVLMPSVVRFDQALVRDYYVCGAVLNEGLAVLSDFMGREADAEVLKYGMQVLFLEKMLSKNAALMRVLRSRLAGLQRQAAHFSPDHESVVAQAASVYQATVGQAGARIMVSGNPRFLQQQESAERIRALLLCAVRAAALWRAEGGSRWQLMFSQRGVAERARALYQEGALC